MEPLGIPARATHRRMHQAVLQEVEVIDDRASARELLARRLVEDLMGARKPDEVLTDRPTDTYLTGILWPQRIAMQGEDDDSLAAGAGGEGASEDTEASAVPTNSVQKPSVAGVSFGLARTAELKVHIHCSFG